MLNLFLLLLFLANNKMVHYGYYPVKNAVGVMVHSGRPTPVTPLAFSKIKLNNITVYLIVKRLYEYSL